MGVDIPEPNLWWCTGCSWRQFTSGYRSTDRAIARQLHDGAAAPERKGSWRFNLKTTDCRSKPAPRRRNHVQVFDIPY